MMLRRLRALAGGARPCYVRYGHSATQMSSAEKHRIVQEVQAIARDDAAAAQRLGALMSASTAQNLARALVVVRHEQKQQLTPLSPGMVEPQVTISMQELKYVALQQGLPFIGFGFVDNAIMIIAGDYIDVKLGVSLGISSMAAAGIGNTISDIAGLGLGGVVEDFCARLGLPTPSLSPEQMMLKQTRVAKTVGSSIGVTIGCLLGMLPLLFMETRNSHSPSPSSPEDVALA